MNDGDNLSPVLAITLFMLSNGKQKLFLILSGIGVGFINGFLGGGGGTLVVVALLSILALSQKQAHATALLIILPISLVSAVVYLINGYFEWKPTLMATIGVIGGGVVGSLLLNKIKGGVVKLIFALITILSAIRMFVAV
ncbi:MAG: TSUP family transporter [Clostridia bacterium]|nr:TSUP family transporter [Clostridia bacterium]